MSGLELAIGGEIGGIGRSIGFVGSVRWTGTGSRVSGGGRAKKVKAAQRPASKAQSAARLRAVLQ